VPLGRSIGPARRRSSETEDVLGYLDAAAAWRRRARLAAEKRPGRRLLLSFSMRAHHNSVVLPIRSRIPDRSAQILACHRGEAAGVHGWSDARDERAERGLAASGAVGWMGIKLQIGLTPRTKFSEVTE
jgi:hypothetical protein